VLISLDLKAISPLYISSLKHFNFRLFKAFSIYNSFKPGSRRSFKRATLRKSIIKGALRSLKERIYITD
jgi:hypothetical protein